MLISTAGAKIPGLKSPIVREHLIVNSQASTLAGSVGYALYGCNKLYSYNSRGLNDLRKIYLESLLLKCDLLYLQEHWLADAQLDAISPHHFVCGVSGFNSLDVLRDRPFGGWAIFWRRDISTIIEVIACNSR